MLLCLKYLGSTSLANWPWSSTWKLFPLCQETQGSCSRLRAGAVPPPRVEVALGPSTLAEARSPGLQRAFQEAPQSTAGPSLRGPRASFNQQISPKNSQDPKRRQPRKQEPDFSYSGGKQHSHVQKRSFVFLLATETKNRDEKTATLLFHFFPDLSPKATGRATRQPSVLAGPGGGRSPPLGRGTGKSRKIPMAVTRTQQRFSTQTQT